MQVLAEDQQTPTDSKFPATKARDVNENHKEECHPIDTSTDCKEAGLPALEAYDSSSDDQGGRGDLEDEESDDNVEGETSKFESFF